MKTDAILRQSSALRAPGELPCEYKGENDLPDDPIEAIKAIAESFEAFRTSHDEEIKALKKGNADPVLNDRLEKIEKSLGDATELKAAIDAAVAAEKREREALELRLERLNIKGDGEAAKAELELKEFNLAAQALANVRNRSFEPLDQKGYEEYKGSWDKWARLGKEELTADEVKAMSVGSDADGGYLVTPDMSGRMVKRVYETSPIRQIASVQTISTDKLEGDEDLGEAGAGWVGETETRSDTDTPQLGQWEIEVFEMYAQPKATQKLLDDASVNVENWLADKVADRFSRLENTAFVAGTGVRQPKGFAAYGTSVDSGSGVTWGTIGHIVSGANGDFVTSNPADKIHDMVGLMKAAFLANSRWVTRRTVITKIRKFKGGDGQYLWQPSLVAGQPETLAGYPITRAEDLPALSTGSLSLYFGDFREAYQIVDRQGNRVLRDPFTGKPYVKFYTTRRVGGGIVNFEAIKAMKFST